MNADSQVPVSSKIPTSIEGTPAKHGCMGYSKDNQVGSSAQLDTAESSMNHGQRQVTNMIGTFPNNNI